MSIENTIEQIAPALRALGEFAGTKRYEQTDLEVRMWREFLKKVDLEAFLRFLTSWGMREKFMPQPADAARALGIVATPEQRFEEAMQAVAQVGPYRSPRFSDAVLHQAITLMGGWVSFCEEAPSTADNFAYTAFKKRFVEMYTQATSQVEVQRLMPQPLVGLADASRANLALTRSRHAALTGPAVAAEAPNLDDAPRP